MTYYLAIDIGASSGRHILGWIEDTKIQTEEIYRFENGFHEVDGNLIWDEEALFHEVLLGIKRCKELNKLPKTIAIDTWGVDYVLLDKNQEVIKPVFCYRDGRGDKAMQQVEEIISSQELYQRGGVQKLGFNTIYQLYSDKQSGRLEKAGSFLMIPAYLSYRLTGTAKNEYTNATTGGFVNAKTYRYDKELTDKLGLPGHLFDTLSEPGESLGYFTDEVEQFVGFSAEVRFCASHDTACAVAATPMKKDDIYISSGTWSLIGTEIETPVLTEEAQLGNYANEGGIQHRFRFLKNYMGMWLFQNIRKNLNKSMTYDEMMQAAEESESFYKIDVNAKEFMAPDNMIEAIRSYLNMPELPLGEVINSVYHSLAMNYAEAVRDIERLAGIHAGAIHIVGGGSKDGYLNRLTAKYTGKPVTAGPVEATAMGNFLSQILADKPEYTLETLRELIVNSCAIEEVTV